MQNRDLHTSIATRSRVFELFSGDINSLVGRNWGTVRDQETWTRIVKANTTSDCDIAPLWANYSMTGVREIWSPDNQLYGYVMHQNRDGVSVVVVDENTMRLHYHRARFGGP